MRRTTILADEELLCEAKQFAAEQGMTFTALVQQALRNYITTGRMRRRISFIGIGRSGSSLAPEEMDEMLRAGLDPVEGWSPNRSGKRRTDGGGSGSSR